MENKNAHLVIPQELNKIFDLIDQLFPFHIIIDRQLNIIQLGKTIKKIDNACLIGNSILDDFELIQPNLEFSFKTFINECKSICMLSFKRNKLKLKGQVIFHEEVGVASFVGGPVLSHGDIFMHHNILLTDFAGYDTLPDFMFSMRAQETSYREIQQLVKQMQRNKEQLTQSNSELQQFAYVASHDLQSPLRTIVGFAQLLEKKYKSSIDEIGKEYLQFIINGTNRMQILISDLLDYSRVQQAQNQFGIVNVNKVIEELIQDFKYDIQYNNARVECLDLPKIYAHSILIKQLFQNLLNNAIKFRQIDDPIIQISVEEKEEEWLFSVKDNGIGFDMENGGKIFEIFQRAVSREAYEGTGIGLAICKKVVEKHKGKIWAESEPLKGSTFYFTISKFLSSGFVYKG